MPFPRPVLFLAYLFVGVAAEAPGDVTLTADFECGLQHPLESLATGSAGTPADPAHFRIAFPNGRQEAGFFLFRLDGVAGQTVRVDFHTDRARNWHTLNPVFAPIDELLEEHGGDVDKVLADPSLFAAKPPPDLPRGVTLPRGIGGSDLPVTHGLFQHWRYMPRAGVHPENKNLFRVEHTFDDGHDTVLVAMKVPYTPKLADAYAKQRLREQHLELRHGRRPDWDVIQIADSSEGRPVWLYRIGEPAEEHRQPKPCILFYAREHGDEHDSSWVTQGVIDFLLSDHRDARAIRRRAVILVIPVLDPDGAANNIYETDQIFAFDDGGDTRQSRQIARWLQAWAGTDLLEHHLDLVVTLHNVESSEGPHLFPYAYEGTPRMGLCHAVHQSVRGMTSAYDVAESANSYGKFTLRLGGWVRATFGGHLMFYEVNTQAPKRHLSLYEVKALGVQMIRGLASHFATREGHELARVVRSAQQARVARWQRYGWLRGLDLQDRTVFSAEQVLQAMPYVEAQYARQEHPPAWIKPLFDRYGKGGPPADTVSIENAQGGNR